MNDNWQRDFDRRVERGKCYGALLPMLAFGWLVTLLLGWIELCAVLTLFGLIVFVAWLFSPPFYNPFDPD